MSRSEPLRLAPPEPSAPAFPSHAGAFGAQLLGQPGQRRGLREGAVALERARAAYLTAEWSGAEDRRPAAGLLKRVGL